MTNTIGQREKLAVEALIERGRAAWKTLLYPSQANGDFAVCNDALCTGLGTTAVLAGADALREALDALEALYAHPNTAGEVKTGEREARKVTVGPCAKNPNDRRLFVDGHQWAKVYGWDKASVEARCDEIVKALALSPTSGGGTGAGTATAFVAGPTWQVDDYWHTEIQADGGDSLVATLYGASEAEVVGYRDACLRALSAAPSSPEDIGGLE